MPMSKKSTQTRITKENNDLHKSVKFLQDYCRSYKVIRLESANIEVFLN